MSDGHPLVGFGYDAHAFGPIAGSVVLCGVEVGFDRVVSATSDGDVAAHALTDALLGATGLGDLGQYFPSSDPQWTDVASLEVFVADAVRRVAELGYRVHNVDVTVLAQRVRIAPHRETMRANVAAVTGADLDRVSVKATTTDGLGFIGRDEGLAAMAIVSLVRSG